MLRLLLLTGWRTWKRLESLFDSTFEPVFLFALLGLALSALLLDLHVRAVPLWPTTLLVRWEGHANKRLRTDPHPQTAGTVSTLDQPALLHRRADE